MMMFVSLQLVRFGYKIQMVRGQIMVQLVIIRGQASQAEEQEKTVINEKDEDGVHKKVYMMVSYNINLLIKHPSIDPEIITEQLGLVPFRAWRFGEPRLTPKGTLLAGVWRDSSWSWQLKCQGKRAFFESVGKLVRELEPHSKFLSDLVLDGGNICLIVNLPGRKNIGDVLSWQLMAKMAHLKIDMGIEVFPDWVVE